MLHKFKYNKNISNFKKQLKKQEKKEKNSFPTYPNM